MQGGDLTSRCTPRILRSILTAACFYLWFGAIGQAQPAIGFQLFQTPTKGSVPHGIAAGPEGAVWFTESAANRIGRITPSGDISEFLIPTPNSQPESITAGPDGNMWFTEPNAGQIGRITPAGTITEFTIPTPNSGPWVITPGPDDALWFTETKAHAIGRIDMGGRVTSFALWPQMTPRGITSGPDGNLWFTEWDQIMSTSSSDRIGRITPGGVITEFWPPSRNYPGKWINVTQPDVHVQRPDAISTGPDGKLWFTNQYTLTGGSYPIGTITTTGVYGTFRYDDHEHTQSQGFRLFAPGAGLTSGPDGALWSTVQANLGLLARIAFGSALSGYTDPVIYNAQSYGITSGADGSVWCTVTHQEETGGPIISAVARATFLTTAIGPLPAAKVGEPYDRTVAITGGAPPFSWSAIGLPPGLAISSDGAITGTATIAGAFKPLLIAQNQSRPPVRAGIRKTIDSQELTLGSDNLPSAFVIGASITQQLTVSDGTPPYKWTTNNLRVTANGDGATATLSGAKYVPGDYPLVIQVTDSSIPPRMATRSSPLKVLGFYGLNYSLGPGLGGPGFSVYPGVPVSAVLQPVSGTPPYTWSASDLPRGLTLAEDGVLSGTPEPGDASSFVLTLQDNSDPQLTLVTPAHLHPLQPAVLMVPVELPDGVLRTPYSANLTAIGGNPPYHWTATDLPRWLTLSDGGLLSGVPDSVAGSGALKVTVVDSSNPPLTDKETLRIRLAQVLAGTITTNSLPPAILGVQYWQPIFQTNPENSLIVSEGTLPAGLSIAFGAISGVPKEAGSFAFTVQSTNGFNQIGTQWMTLRVVSSPTPLVLTSDLPLAYVDVPYEVRLTATGGTPPYEWVPWSANGLTLSQDGLISGTPSGGTAGMNLPATVRDSGTPSLSATSDLTLYVRTLTPTSVIITTPTLPFGTVGEYYSAVLGASGGAAPYHWTVTSSSLPPGLTLNSESGVISGIPTQAGTFTRITVELQDSQTGKAQLEVPPISIHGAPLIGPPQRIGIFSQVSSGGGEATSLYLTNPTVAPAEVRVSFWENAGAAMKLPLSFVEGGSAVVRDASALTVTLGANSTMSIETASTEPVVLSGWAELLSANPGVSGYSVLRITSGTGLVSESAAPLQKSSSPIVLLPYEAKDGLEPRFSVVNLSPMYATSGSIVTWAEDGTLLNQSTIDVAAHSQAVVSLPELFPTITGHRGFVQLSSFAEPGLTGPALAGLGLRAGTSGRFTHVSPLAGVQPGSPNTDGLISLVLSGGGWKSSIYLVNPLDNGVYSSGVALPYLDFYDGDGNPLILPITATQDGIVQTHNVSSVRLKINPNSTAVVETDSEAATVLTGWARVRDVGVQSTMGYGVVHGSAPDGATWDATVPLDFQNGSVLTLPYDCVNGLRMGVSIAALNAARVIATAIDENGTSLPIATITLPSQGQAYFNLTDKIPAAVGHRGYVQFIAVPTSDTRPSAVSGIGLRYHPAGGFTTVPRLD